MKKTKSTQKKHAKDGAYLNCPRCNIEMKKLKKNDVYIDVCKKCRGMWVDAGEVEKLAAMK